MEKNYAERVMEIKSEILKEIRELLPDGETHKFENTFYVHYVNGEVATTEVCMAVTNDCGSVGFNVAPDDVVADVTDNFVDGEDVFNFEPNTFMDVLENLRKELREKKLSHLRDLVKKNGGRIDFDGSFGFNSLVDENHVAGEKSMVTCIELDNYTGKRIYLDCNMSGEIMEEQEENIPFDQLDALIAYVESQTKRKFTIRVSGSFSRTFEIEASSYEEALEFAKTEWKEDAPLCPDDSDGENWF